jgi:hypothetical protein
MNSVLGGMTQREPTSVSVRFPIAAAPPTNASICAKLLSSTSAVYNSALPIPTYQGNQKEAPSDPSYPQSSDYFLLNQSLGTPALLQIPLNAQISSKMSGHNIAPDIGEVIQLGHHRFTWTEDHIDEATLQNLQSEYDILGNSTLERLQDIQLKTGQKDLFVTLRDNHSSDEILAAFWTETHTVPEWVDWAQIERGQRFFYKHMAANFVGFALQGFMGENTTTGSTAEVLVKTGGFSTRVLLRRLLETFQWLLQVTKDIGAIKPGGEGHTATIRVRLLHAAVRHRMMKLAASKNGYFDLQKHGVPINSADSMHSIATFGCNPIWLQLPRLGITPTTQEAEDYMALFRYVAYVIGTPQEPFRSAAKGKAWMESIEMILRPTDKSRVLGHNFIECLKNVPPLNLSRPFIEAGTRVINGEDHGNLIGISKPGFLAYCQFYGLCFTLRGMTLAQRFSPRFEDYLVDVSILASMQRLLG